MKSIGTKLALQIALALVVITIITGAFGTYKQQQKLTLRLQAKEERSLHQLSLILGKLLFDLNYQQIENILRSYLTDTDILGIKVLEEGQVVKYIGKAEADTLVSLKETESDPFQEIPKDIGQEPILYEEEELGTVEIIFSRQFIEAQIQQTGRDLFLNILFIILIESLVVILLVRKQVTAPLRSITETTRQLAEGNLRVRLPDVSSSSDEIGILTTAAHSLLTYIESIATIAERISNGDLRHEIAPRSERDVLGRAFLNMSNYLKELAATATAIAAGDLRQIIQPKSEDDILGNAFLQINNLQQTIREIKESSAQLTQASEDLNDVSTQMALATDQVSQQANIVSSSSQQISENVDAVATAMEEMSSSVREISRNTTGVADMAGQAVNISNSTNAALAELERRSQEISEIIAVITSVAQQTNLLALNASIEAARAGDSGKGFAVVAHEIKELSRETAMSTEHIVEKLEAIQTSSKESISAINDVSQIIHQIQDLSTATASGVEQQSITTGEIGHRMSEAAHGSQGITDAIIEVATVAKKTSEGAAQVKQSANELASLADRLHALIAKFQI